jgi:hypothetical protein
MQTSLRVQEILLGGDLSFIALDNHIPILY